ncbi:hypothetical protein C2G38_2235180 [Gigaspora rosea]|uniref:TLDc domain-containing protein n=1 Tax=Gigaspora rosea TaxID=44941 RepID=A0A397TQE8_9GLOM|nr:hypothetical protein C2G38_2235180 [Gigaspora rosea]
MIVACELILEELDKYLETFLIESNAHWLRLHFNLFDSEEFTSFQENALVSSIERDDLQMEEVKIWNYIIKWGIAQNPGLSSNPEDWSNENFLALKSTLKNSEIASWIDKKAISILWIIIYGFKLLLRGSRDGFTRDSFWNLCDKQKNLVIVIKVKDTDEILGGYNPVGWDKMLNSYKSCEESFTFSLKNGAVQTSILSRVKSTHDAIYSFENSGPGFMVVCLCINPIKMIDVTATITLHIMTNELERNLLMIIIHVHTLQ